MSRHPGEDTPEVKAFERSAATLEAGLNPDDVTNLLYSASIITRMDKEIMMAKGSRFEKVEVLISAVTRNLVNNPGNFQKFVDIVNREPSFGALVKKLNEEYEKAKTEAAQQPANLPPRQAAVPQQGQSSSLGSPPGVSGVQGHPYRPPVHAEGYQWAMQSRGYYHYEGQSLPSSQQSSQAYPSLQPMYSGQPYAPAGVGSSVPMASAQAGLPHGSAQGPPAHQVPEPGHCDDMVDDRPLSIRDLFEVTEEVEDVSKWYELGLALGLQPPALDMIKQENHHVVRDCKREMLKEWLRRSSTVQPSSWRELVKALRRKSVRNHDVADSIAKEHSKTAHPPQDRVAVEHPPMHAAQRNQPPSSWPMPPYTAPPGTVSSGYSQPHYDHRHFPQFGGDPTQPLHRNVVPAGFGYRPEPLSKDSSAPWSRNPSYPTYSLREEQSQHGRYECDFERQFHQIAANDEDKKKMIQLIFSKHQDKITAAVQMDLVRFAHMLEALQIINQHTAQDAHGIPGKGPYELAAHILRAVRNKVESYPQYFPKLVQCLEKFDADLSHDLMLHWNSKLLGRN